MFKPELAPEDALAQLAIREKNVTDARLTAAGFCIALATSADHEGMYQTVLDHYELTSAADPDATRKSGVKRFGFWLQGAREMRFADAVIPPVQALSVTVRTQEFIRGDDDGISVALRTEPGRRAMRLDMHMFSEPPQWWLDTGETGPNIGEAFEVNGEENMQRYLAGETAGVTALRATTQIVLESLRDATWEEGVNIADQLY